MDQIKPTPRRAPAPKASSPAKSKTKTKVETKAVAASETEVEVSVEVKAATVNASPAPVAAVPEAADECREWVNRRASAQATRAANARQVSGRRRFVDPTTCEREYSAAEMEFMQAMHDYKQCSGRMFPTWSEVLEVLKALGYEKPAGSSSLPTPRDGALATAQTA